MSKPAVAWYLFTPSNGRHKDVGGSLYQPRRNCLDVCEGYDDDRWNIVSAESDQTRKELLTLETIPWHIGGELVLVDLGPG